MRKTLLAGLAFIALASFVAEALAQNCPRTSCRRTLTGHIVCECIP